MTTTLWILAGVAALVLLSTGLLWALVQLAFGYIQLAFGYVAFGLRHVLKGLGIVLGTVAGVTLTLITFVVSLVPYSRKTVLQGFKLVYQDFSDLMGKVRSLESLLSDLNMNQGKDSQKAENTRIWDVIETLGGDLSNATGTIGVYGDGNGNFEVSDTYGEFSKINNSFKALCAHLGVKVSIDNDGVYTVIDDKAAKRGRKSTR
jgi:hypothetical protein